MKRLLLSLFIVFLAVLASSQYASSIANADMNVSSPATALWIDALNLSGSSQSTNSDINFTYFYTNTSGLDPVNCTLWINNTAMNITNNVAHNTLQGVLSNSTFMNQSYNTWYVACTSSDSITGVSENRTFFVDNDIPIVDTATLVGFTNGTNTSNTTLSITFTGSDTHPNSSFFVEFVNLSDGTVLNSTYANNGTATPIAYTWSSDGQVDFYINFTDNASHENSSFGQYSAFIDTTNPLINYVTASSNGTVTTDTYEFINVSVTDTKYINYITFTFNGTDKVLMNDTNVSADGLSTCSGSRTAINCWFNYTSLGDAIHNFTITTNDTAGNSNSTTERFIIVDTKTPNIVASTVTNSTGADSSSLAVNFTITDANPDSCAVIVQGQDGNATVTGSITSGSDTSHYCIATVTGDNVTGDGQFTIFFNATDDAGTNSDANNASVNYTLTTMTADEWHLLSATTNETLGGISNWSGAITQTALWSNQNKNYTSWVYGASTNHATAVSDGSAVYVYVNETIYLIREWDHANGIGGFARNETIYTGWNQLAFMNNSGTTLNYTTNVNVTQLDETAGLQTIIHVSYYNASTGLYVTHRSGFSLNNATEIPKGQAVWLQINGTTANNHSFIYTYKGVNE